MNRVGNDRCSITVYPDTQTIVVDFGYAVKGLGLDEQGARHLAQLLIEAADELKKRKN
jgi:hypothetical protein